MKYLICLILALGVANCARAQVYYVAPNGGGCNGGSYQPPTPPPVNGNGTKAYIVYSHPQSGVQNGYIPSSGGYNGQYPAQPKVYYYYVPQNYSYPAIGNGNGNGNGYPPTVRPVIVNGSVNGNVNGSKGGLIFGRGNTANC